MHRKAPFAWILILLFGFVLGVSTLLLADPATRAQPTLEPTPWPTATPYQPPTPTEVLQLPVNCIPGQQYQLQFVDAQSAYIAPPLFSPDGMASVYEDSGNIYLHPSGKPPVHLRDNGGYMGALDTFAHWSPDSQYLAWIASADSPLIIINADGSNRHTITQLEYPAAFLGWSPDSRSLALQEHYLNDVSIWTVDGQRTFTTGDHDWLIRYGPYWSADGRWMVVNWRDNTNLEDGLNAPYGLTLAAADGSKSYDLLLTDDWQDIEPFRVDAVWSPDSRSFAAYYLQYRDSQYFETVKVYDIDGDVKGGLTTPIIQPVYNDLNLWSTNWSPVRWSPDSQSLTYIHPAAVESFDLYRFDLANGQFTMPESDLGKPPFYAPDADYTAIYTGRTRPFNIYTLHTADSQRVPLVTDASDAGDPDWSPDGEWVAAVWATGEKDTRRVFLSFMHPDGSGRQDIDADFRDVRDLRWLGDGSTLLAYVAWRGETASVEVVDTATGVRTTVATNLSQVNALTSGRQSDASPYSLSFWWQNTDGEQGKDTYAIPDWTLTQRIAYPVDLAYPRKEFWSPDGEVVAIKIVTLVQKSFTDELLVLAYTDGRPAVLVRSGLSGLGDPLWSPDGQSLAFTQSRNMGDVALHRVDTNGINQWEYTPFQVGRVIEWVACG